jgi:hypothetical protein
MQETGYRVYWRIIHGSEVVDGDRGASAIQPGTVTARVWHHGYVAYTSLVLPVVATPPRTDEGT